MGGRAAPRQERDRLLGRSAMNHCSEEVKSHWTKYLEGIGIDIHSLDKTGDIKDEADLKRRLKKIEE